MLLGDEVEDLRRTVGGGRGSSRQPFTWSGGAQEGDTILRMRAPLVALLPLFYRFFCFCVCLLQHGDRPVCVGLEVEGGDKGMQGQEVSSN